MNVKNLDVMLNDRQQNIIILSSAKNLRVLCKQTTTMLMVHSNNLQNTLPNSLQYMDFSTGITYC